MLCIPGVLHLKHTFIFLLKNRFFKSGKNLFIVAQNRFNYINNVFFFFDLKSVP